MKTQYMTAQPMVTQRTITQRIVTRHITTQPVLAQLGSGFQADNPALCSGGSTALAASEISHKPSRRAATILEVLFATVVIVIGLLGIATLIPFAARDAQTANNHNQAVSLGSSWADSFFARGWHQAAPKTSQQGYGWRWFRDFSFNGSPPAWEDFVIGIPSFASNSDLGGAGRKLNRLWGFTPVCIDPYTMTSASEGTLFQKASMTNSAYRVSVFPYFDDGYDPTTNPMNPVNTDFDDQPRMLRATLGFGEPIGSPTILGRRLIESLFSSTDALVGDTYIDPATATPESESFPARRLFQTSSTGVQLRSLMDGQFTWMATVVPYEPGGSINESVLVSFLIMHRHNHTVDFTKGPSALGERQTVVTPLSGDFVGGAGGRVRISCSVDVEDKLQVGDWIMLSRLDNAMPFALKRPHFRWYRITGLDAESSVNNSIWSRELVLDGPDFIFDTVGTNFGTIVGGIVTIIERQVRLE